MSDFIERFPTSSPRGRAVLYAVGYADGRIKFGKTHAPRCRLRALTKAAPADWAHVFGPIKPSDNVGKPCPAEVHAWTYAQRAGAVRVGRTEQFTGITKEQAIACGRAARLAEFTEPKAAA